MKKIIRFSFLIFLICGASLKSNAQYISNGVIQDANSPNLRGLIHSINGNPNENVEGSPYVNESFLLAKISSLDDKPLAVRYNAFDDQFEIKGGNETSYLLNKYRTDITIEFINPVKTYKSYSYIDEDSNQQIMGYFVILNPESKIKLLKKEIIKFVEGKVGVTSYERDKPAKFRRNSDKFYIKSGDDDVQPLPSNKKEIAGLFPKNSEGILNFIKKNKIKTNKEEDLVELINFINSF